MNLSNLHPEVQKYLLSTDVVTEVESRTKNHYNINSEYSVVRDDKTYFIRIKEVDVIGTERKHHTRIEIDTNLKDVNPKKSVDILKIKSDIEKIENWIKVNERYYKGSDYLFKQKMKLDRLKSKL